MSLPLPLLLLEAEPVVVPGVPVRVHLHVLLPLHAGLLVVAGLLLAAQGVPLYCKGVGGEGAEKGGEGDGSRSDNKRGGGAGRGKSLGNR